MKVLMVNKFLQPHGGAETYVLSLGKQLADIGHEVEYFGMDQPGRCVGNSGRPIPRTWIFTAEASW